MQPSPFIIKFVSAFKDNYIWLLLDQNNSSAWAVDPGDAKPLLDFLASNHLQLKGILLTHHHWDHCDGVPALLQHYDVPLFGGAKEKFPFAVQGVKENDSIEVNESSIRVIDIPGHTLGHVAYYGNGALFCGDTLFTAGCGRLFEGTAEQMYHSLKKLQSLPDETQVYCGHEYTLSNLRFAHFVTPDNAAIQQRLQTVSALRDKNLPTVPASLIEEKMTNPFLRCESPEIIAAVSHHAGKKLNNPVDVFTELRCWKNNF